MDYVSPPAPSCPTPTPDEYEGVRNNQWVWQMIEAVDERVLASRDREETKPQHH